MKLLSQSLQPQLTMNLPYDIFVNLILHDYLLHNKVSHEIAIIALKLNILTQMNNSVALVYKQIYASKR